MQAETKKLGILLIEAGMITPAQLQEALRHQRISGGRLGSTLVALGAINEENLMDFLARQTGVPRMDVRNLDIPAAVLQRIPRRMAEQLTILPLAFKEPKSLVLAMADPMDLNAIDSARFASGLTIEPVVAAHMVLKQAIGDHYNRLGAGRQTHPGSLEPAASPDPRLPVPLELAITPLDRPEAPSPTSTAPGTHAYPKDPFYDPHNTLEHDPFNFFSDPTATDPGRPMADPAVQPSIIHQRSAMQEQLIPLENFGTRALVLGLIRLLQRRGVVAQDELQRLLQTLAEAREIDPDK